MTAKSKSRTTTGPAVRKGTSAPRRGARTWGLPRLRPPTHPGEMLREDFLPDYGLNVSGLAKALDVSRQTINELLRERRAVSPAMALRLSRLFGNSPEFWLNAQRALDLWEANRALKTQFKRIKPLRSILAESRASISAGKGIAHASFWKEVATRSPETSKVRERPSRTRAAQRRLPAAGVARRDAHK
jgi:antitoxin HigA-1